VGEVEKMIAALRKNPSTSQVKIMVGGYPFNIDRDLWKKIGADASATSARNIEQVAEGLLKE
jgi:methanogenic corrinoid protein MtbC1